MWNKLLKDLGISHQSDLDENAIEKLYLINNDKSPFEFVVGLIMGSCNYSKDKAIEIAKTAHYENKSLLIEDYINKIERIKFIFKKYGIDTETYKGEIE